MSDNSNNNTITDRLPEFTKTLSQKERWLEEIGVLKSELQYVVVDNAMMRYEIPIPLILQTRFVVRSSVSFWNELFSYISPNFCNYSLRYRGLVNFDM